MTRRSDSVAPIAQFAKCAEGVHSARTDRGHDKINIKQLQTFYKTVNHLKNNTRIEGFAKAVRISTTEPHFVRDRLRGKGNTKELRFSDCKVVVQGDSTVRKLYAIEDYAWDQETFGYPCPPEQRTPEEVQATLELDDFYSHLMGNDQDMEKYLLHLETACATTTIGAP